MSVLMKNMAETTFRAKTNTGNIKNQIHADNDNKKDLEITTQEVLHYDEAENFVFDSVYVHFDLSVFIHQFVLHMFLPFTIWMSPSPKSQLMWWDKDISYGDMFGTIFLLVLNTTAFVSIICYEFLPVEDRIHYFGAVAYPILFSSMWRLSVATKYAMFSPTEYKRILTFKSWAINDAYYDQTLINTNLIDFQNDHVNRFEIAAGAHRADVTNVDMIKFMMENPDSSNVAKMRLDEWNHFLMCTTPELKTANKYRVEKSSIEKSIMDDVTLGTNTVVADHIKAAASPASRSDKDEFSNKVKKENMIGPDGYHFDLQKQSDGSYALSLFDACRHIQQYAHQEAGKELNSRLNWMSMCVVFLVTLIPFFTCINGTYKITSNITIVFLAFTTFDCMFFLRTIFTRFMMGAIIDYRRQFIMQRAFNDLLRTSEFDNEIRFTVEGHWQSADRKLHKAKDQKEYEARYGKEEKLNKNAVKVFHVARESEVRKRRQTLERNTVMAEGIRDMLRQVKQREGEGKSDIENMLNGGESEHEDVLPRPRDRRGSRRDHVDQHRYGGSSLGDHSMQMDEDAVHFISGLSSKSYSSVGDAVTPDIAMSPFVATPAKPPTHSIQTFLKDNYYENSMLTTRGPNTSRLPVPNPSGVVSFPRLSMDFDGNIFSWVQARQVMTTFKIRFRRRIEVVAGIFFLATGGSIIGCLATIYSSNDIAAAYSTPLVLQTIVVVTAFALALIRYVSEAAKINGMFERHKLSIRKHQLRIHSMMAHCQQILSAPEIRAKLEQRNNALEACACFIETANHNDPCEVFGIKADSAVALSILSALISFFVTLISIYYYNGGEKTYHQVTSG